MERRRVLKFGLIGAVLALALGYLLVSGMKASMVYYLTLDELLAQGKAKVGEGVRLAGRVKEGSVSGSPVEGISFVMTDGAHDLAVSYRGQVPDTFEEGGEVVVEGVYRARPVFEAGTLLAKCPSKYEAADTPSARTSE